MASWDDVSDQTRADFEAVYGDGAQQAWEAEHAHDTASSSSNKKNKTTKNGASGIGQDSSGGDSAFNRWLAGQEGATQAGYKNSLDQVNAQGKNSLNSVKAQGKNQIDVANITGLTSRDVARIGADSAIQQATLRAQVDREDIAARLQLAADASNWDKEKFPQLLAQENAKIELTRRNLEELGVPAQKLAEWKAGKDYELALAAHDLDRQRVDIQRQQVTGDQANVRAGLGRDLLTTAANLNNAGAAKAFQYANFMDSVKANPDAQNWLNTLFAGTQPGSSLQGFASNPNAGAVGLNTVANDLTSSGTVPGGTPVYDATTGTYITRRMPSPDGGPAFDMSPPSGGVARGGLSPEDQAAKAQRDALLKSFQPIYTQPNKLGPQAMAMWTPTQAGIIQSGAEVSGHPWEDVYAAYKKAGIGQGVGA